LQPIDFAATKVQLQKLLGHEPNDQETITYLLYPKVYQDFVQHQTNYSDTSTLPTPVFFFGIQNNEEIAVEIESGKTLILKLVTVGEPHPDGRRTVFFELNGQPRSITVADASVESAIIRRQKADPNDPRQIAAPMPGLVVNVAAQVGDEVVKGQKLLALEAMKMETTLYAELDGKVSELFVKPGSPVEAGDLLVRME
jgi:pyruvate carboxylase